MRKLLSLIIVVSILLSLNSVLYAEGEKDLRDCFRQVKCASFCG